ncbi:MFS transporter [Jeotgalibacillus terrae]|uniref:MFS transporter n=1 Tax=Jeotgalibacillus terrae TaxID=587735 RepID=A0ABW5ZHJ6_9BACL|nr:MFS transporter [Jeotgalibacillus terrae]MBM7578760.1 MFS family permease [Jeotgalibacillus terrae]
MKAMFINRHFAKMWYSNAASILGDRFREIVIPLIVLGLSGSPLITALVVMSQQLGALLFAVPVGVWVEKRNKPLIAAVANFLYAIGLLFLAFFILFESSVLVAFTLFVMGLLALISRTAFNTMIPAVAGRKNLMPAHTSLEAADAVTTLAGPVIGGLLYTYTGSFATLVVCACLSCISSLFLFRLKSEYSFKSATDLSDQTNQIHKNRFFKEASVGFSYLFSSVPQRIHALAISVLSFSTVYIMLLVVIHGETVMNLSAAQIGLLLSAAGVGNIIGVLLLKYFQQTNWILLLSVLLGLSGIGVLIVFLSDSFWMAFLGVLIFDGALSMAFVIQGAAHQGITPDDVLTRIRSAAYVIGGLSGLAGTFLAGFIPELSNTAVALGMGSAVLLLPAIYMSFFKKRGAAVESLEPINIGGGEK